VLKFTALNALKRMLERMFPKLQKANRTIRAMRTRLGNSMTKYVMIEFSTEVKATPMKNILMKIRLRKPPSEILIQMVARPITLQKSPAIKVNFKLKLRTKIWWQMEVRITTE
jgi:hypothetical protein